MIFSMKVVKLVNIPFALHCKLSWSLCLGYKKKNVMSRILYASTVWCLLYVMKWLDISQCSWFVNGYMENASKVVKWVLWYFRGTSITYSGCSDLVCGYVDSNFTGDLDRKRFISGHECKGLLVSFKNPYSRKSCINVNETSIVREVAVVIGFSWLVGKVMNKSRQGIR